MSQWLKGLNPEQVQAVMHTYRPMLILAGAGSGKTTVLVARAGRLIDEEKVPAQRICVMTFTNKAARELKERLKIKIGAKAKGLWAGTFHAFGLQFLKKYYSLAGLPKGFGVISASDAVAIVKELAGHMQVGDKKDFDAEKLLAKIQYLREHGRRPAIQDDYDDLAEILLPKYNTRLMELGVVDFDDLLLKPIAILQKHAEVRDEIQEYFQHVMVDEFQDTNNMQMQLIRLISDKHRNLTVVGDDDQSIYGWRGAQVSNILNFPNQYKADGCKVVRLVRNYRSTPEIIHLANEVIKRNQDRHDKTLLPAAGEQGEKPEVFVYENEDEEIERICCEIERLRAQEQMKWENFAILYRSNGQGALFEAEFRKRGWPYQITGGTAFFDRKEVKDALSYLRCALRPHEVGLRRILNAPPRGIGLTTLQKIEEQAKREKISFYKSLCRWQSAEVGEPIGQHIDTFLRFLTSICDRLLAENDPSPISRKMVHLLDECGYRTYLENNSKNHEAFSKKWAIVEIFCRILDSFVAKGGLNKKTLTEFVEAMELRDSDVQEDTKDKINLMTLHASKGLEFPVVFLVGLEEDLLPHRTLGGDICEERRLFYVGVTRAKQRLMISRVRWRKRYGKSQPCAPSRFLLEVPESVYQCYESGFRPVSEEQRKNQLADLFAQLDSQIAVQSVSTKRF